MKTKLTLILILFISAFAFAQKTDTLAFQSKAFNQKRTIYVTTPDFYKTQSKEIKLPVIYILDGQHEWLVNPLLSTIKYLQYTHQIPQAIVVTIPLLNRVRECGIKSIEGDELPLHQFITKEVDEQIQQYHPSQYKMLIGHSFSASFSLYSYLKSPKYYSAVIANTPLDSFKELVLAMEKNKEVDKSKIFISTGGKAKNQDYYHRKLFDDLKAEFPIFFNTITTFVAENSGHTAVPIVATPYLLTQIFVDFNGRYSKIAQVDNNYKLITAPTSIKDEITKIEEASKLGNYFYPPELADLNGLASRYEASGLKDYEIAVYEMATKYFSGYYGFHFELYKLLLPNDKNRSKAYLNRAQELLSAMNLPERREVLGEIAKEKAKNGW